MKIRPVCDRTPHHSDSYLIATGYRAFRHEGNLTVFVNPDSDPKVSSTADASYPQCTMQSAHFSLRPVPESQSVFSMSSRKASKPLCSK